jgi:hypothetical protein
MPDILSTIAAQTGIDPSTIEKVVGAIMNFLKAHLPPDLFAKLESRIPEANKLAESVEDQPEGLLGMASKLAGKLMGSSGEAGADLLGNFLKAGVPAETAAQILPRIFDALSRHLPPEALEKLRHSLPSIPGLDMTKVLPQEGSEAAPATEPESIPPAAPSEPPSDFV